MRLTKKELCSYTNMELNSMQMDWHSIYNKLAEFEDFMEEQGFESLEELKINIEYLKDKIKTDKFNYEKLHKFKNHLQEENSAIKERWEKLWDWICDKNPISKGANAIFKKSEILDKMRELELNDLIRKKDK